MKVKRVFSGLEREKEKETSWFIIILITARYIIHGENFKISSFVRYEAFDDTRLETT